MSKQTILWKLGLASALLTAWAGARDRSTRAG